MHTSPRVLPVFIILTMCLNEEYARNLNKNSAGFSPTNKLDVNRFSVSQSSQRSSRAHKNIGQFLLSPYSDSTRKQHSGVSHTDSICGNANKCNAPTVTTNKNTETEAGVGVDGDGSLSEDQVRQALVQEEIDEYYLLGHILPREGDKCEATTQSCDDMPKVKTTVHNSDLDMPLPKTDAHGKGRVMPELKVSEVEHNPQPGQWMVFANPDGPPERNRPRHQPVFRPAHPPFVMNTIGLPKQPRQQVSTYNRGRPIAHAFSLPSQHTSLMKSPTWMTASLNSRPQKKQHLFQSKDSGFSGGIDRTNCVSNNPYENTIINTKTIFPDRRGMSIYKTTDMVNRVMGEHKVKYNNLRVNQKNYPHKSVSGRYQQFRSRPMYFQTPTTLNRPTWQQFTNHKKYNQNFVHKFNLGSKSSQKTLKGQKRPFFKQQIADPYTTKAFTAIKSSENPRNFKNEIVLPLQKEGSVILRIPSHLYLTSDTFPYQTEDIKKVNEDDNTGDNELTKVLTFSNRNYADRHELLENSQLSNNRDNINDNSEISGYQSIENKDGATTYFENISPKTNKLLYRTNLKNLDPSSNENCNSETSYLNLLHKPKSTSASLIKKLGKGFKLIHNNKKSNTRSGNKNYNFDVTDYKLKDENNIMEPYREISRNSKPSALNYKNLDVDIYGGNKNKPQYETHISTLAMPSRKQENLDDATIQEMIDNLDVELSIPVKSKIEERTQRDKNKLGIFSDTQNGPTKIQREHKFYQPIKYNHKVESIHENGKQDKHYQFLSNRSLRKFRGRPMLEEMQDHDGNQDKSLIPDFEGQENQISQHKNVNSDSGSIIRLEKYAHIGSLSNNNEERLSEKGDVDSLVDSDDKHHLPTADLGNEGSQLEGHDSPTSNKRLFTSEDLGNSNIGRFIGIDELVNNLLQTKSPADDADNVMNVKKLTNSLVQAQLQPADLQNNIGLETNRFDTDIKEVQKLAQPVKRLHRRQLDQEFDALDVNAVVDVKVF